MSENVFRFEDPPAHGRRTREDEAQKLRENPGRWALIAIFDTAKKARCLASVIRIGATSVWQPAGDFEAASRSVGNEHRVYARYLGDGKDSDDE